VLGVDLGVCLNAYMKYHSAPRLWLTGGAVLALCWMSEYSHLAYSSKKSSSGRQTACKAPKKNGLLDIADSNHGTTVGLPTDSQPRTRL